MPDNVVKIMDEEYSFELATYGLEGEGEVTLTDTYVVPEFGTIAAVLAAAGVAGAIIAANTFKKRAGIVCRHS